MKTLLLVDIQNDFVPGGALPVPEGDAIIPVVNGLLGKFDHVVATQDWHPANHGSFASVQGKAPGDHILLDGVDQVLWPDHCVQGTKGADFAEGLQTDKIQKVVQKGLDPAVDSYSGFFDNARKHKTDLDDYFRGKGVEELWVAGLATDYCVKFTVLDALGLGYKVNVIADACKGLEVHTGDVERALVDMQNAGAVVLLSKQL